MTAAVVVFIKNKRFELNERHKNHMQLFAQSEAISGKPTEEFTVDIFQPETFQEMLRLLNFAEQIGYQFPDLPTIRTNNLEEILPSQLVKQMQKKNIEQLNQLFKIAHYFICLGVRKIVVATVACKIYFQPTLKGYYEMRATLNIKRDMSEERKMIMKEKFPFYN